MEESHWWLQLSGLKENKKKKIQQHNLFLKSQRMKSEEAAVHRRMLGPDGEPLGLLPPGPKPGAVPTIRGA